MGKKLYERESVFKTAIDRCQEILKSFLKVRLTEVLFSDPAGLIDQTEYTQPCLFALEYALSELWKSYGIKPSAVMGHSVGEYAAACVAGVFSLEDGLKLIAHRARLMQALPGAGGMAAVKADEESVLAVLKGHESKLSIGAVNGPKSMVISGDQKALEQVLSELEKRGKQAIPLKVSHAFHSPQMDAMLEEFEKTASEIKYSQPQITFVSNLYGRRVTEEVCQAKYWREHVRREVRVFCRSEVARR